MSYTEIQDQAQYELFCDCSDFFKYIEWEENPDVYTCGLIKYREKEPTTFKVGDVIAYSRTMVVVLPRSISFFVRVTIPEYIKHKDADSDYFFTNDVISDDLPIKEIISLRTKAAVDTIRKAIAKEEAWRAAIDEKIKQQNKESHQL